MYIILILALVLLNGHYVISAASSSLALSSSSNNEAQEPDKCPICHTEIKIVDFDDKKILKTVEDKDVIITICMHKFCSPCMHDYINIYCKRLCPICRTDLLTGNVKINDANNDEVLIAIEDNSDRRICTSILASAFMGLMNMCLYLHSALTAKALIIPISVSPFMGAFVHDLASVLINIRDIVLNLLPLTLFSVYVLGMTKIKPPLIRIQNIEHVIRTNIMAGLIIHPS